ncbi:MAG: biotin--[acetyl-CoA-carboxylase] ligase [Dehalococcoidia bacterium]|nr:MAG: biotin--[acetyl-CoA-carboxylase] ligase [Dehalococcoidia bacterium]
MVKESDITSYLKHNLATRYMGKTAYYIPVTSSTMDEARILAEQDAPEGTAIIAGKQQTGRGRMGRAWLSPEGGLATSIILRPPVDALRLLPAIASVAVYKTIEIMGIHASIKWPNDVLISGKKVCGILIENTFNEVNLVYSVIGIGINVNFETTLFPEIADIATSLSIELGKEVSVAEVALNLYSEMENLYDRIDEPDFILGEWIRHMGTIGKRVSAKFGIRTIEGIAQAINPDGNLVLRLDDGSLHEIIAGDVTNIRDKAK